MSEQIIIRIERIAKEKLNRLSKVEGKTTSQVLRELIGQYIREHDLASYIDDLWERIGEKSKAKGFGRPPTCNERFVNPGPRSRRRGCPKTS